MVESRAFAPCYYSNPVVEAGMEDGELVLPTALYMDGVPYSLTDSVVGVWLVNLVTGNRSLLAMVRKRLVCKCGCNGWCTFFPLLVFLHWAFGAMATGVLPLMGPLLEAWSGARAVVAGTAMRLKYCLLYLKGDWP